MRIPPAYSEYRLDMRGQRLGAIHIALRKGQTPHHHARVNHGDYFRLYTPTTAAALHRWPQYLKHAYPERTP